ncbi:PR-1-like protein [Lentinus brumalis]|uniref:PR-1-like protein n=1 Tax=Lentinus brumalis TaxID=2498619 RepID=A0A371DCC7_9APHY|nr:PR-1-like protein [Polyporus brumalis]
MTFKTLLSLVLLLTVSVAGSLVTRDTSASDVSAYLSAHNTVRSQHRVSPLTWSSDLSAKAQTWVNNCTFQHSNGKLGRYGENLAAGTGSSYGIGPAIKSWTDEVSQYNAYNPQPSHYTQVVWKGTTQVGCAVQTCKAGTIFDAKYGSAKFYVCEYNPPGISSANFRRTSTCRRQCLCIAKGTAGVCSEIVPCLLNRYFLVGNFHCVSPRCVQLRSCSNTTYRRFSRCHSSRTSKVVLT